MNYIELTIYFCVYGNTGENKNKSNPFKPNFDTEKGLFIHQIAAPV